MHTLKPVFIFKVQYFLMSKVRLLFLLLVPECMVNIILKPHFLCFDIFPLFCLRIEENIVKINNKGKKKKVECNTEKLFVCKTFCSHYNLMVFSLGIFFLAPFARVRTVKEEIIKSGNANLNHQTKLCF